MQISRGQRERDMDEGRRARDEVTGAGRYFQHLCKLKHWYYIVWHTLQDRLPLRTMVRLMYEAMTAG